MTIAQRTNYSNTYRLAAAVVILAAAGLYATPAPAQYHPPPPTMEQVVDASVSDPRLSPKGPVAGVIIRKDALLSKPTISSTEATVSLERLKHAPPPKALRKLQKAKELAAKGKVKKSIKAYQAAIKIHPDFIEAHNNIGVQYLKIDKPELALKHLDIAADLAPEEALPHLNMAMALHFVGDLDAALLNAERALKLAPTLPEANLNMGALLVQRGTRLGEAIRRLNRVDEEFPIAALIKADAFLQRGETTEASVELRSFMQTYRAEELGPR